MADVVKFFDNKQLVHIASEVIVLVGLIFYFSSKNKKMFTHIEELSHRIEEQEDHIQKLELSLQQIGQKFDVLVQQVNAGFNQIGQNMATKKAIKQQVRRDVKEVKQEVKQPLLHKTPVIEEVKPFRSENKVEFKPEIIEEDVDEVELSDSDLDEEIRDELNELDSSLKKEI